MINFHNIHKNERTFIVANGPGLNDIDVSKMEGSVVFALNRGYRKDGLPITYLVVVNDLIEKQFKKEIVSVPTKAFFSNSISGTNILRWTPDIPSFRHDPRKPMWQGHTVTYVAMQLAFHMGCNPVYVVGLDHYYDYSTSTKEKGRGLVSQGKDPNHFDPEYFGKGIRWDKANLKKSEEAYALARKAYNDEGRQLWNASSKTHLSTQILPRFDYESIFVND